MCKFVSIFILLLRFFLASRILVRHACGSSYAYTVGCKGDQGHRWVYRVLGSVSQGPHIDTLMGHFIYLLDTSMCLPHRPDIYAPHMYYPIKTLKIYKLPATTPLHQFL